MGMYNPAHPGEILQNCYLEPYGLSVRKLPIVLGFSHSALSRLVAGKAAVSPDMAVRLEKSVSLTAGACLGMQRSRDLWEVRERNRHDEIEPIDFEVLLKTG